jgi:hypothetical protein
MTDPITPPSELVQEWWESTIPNQSTSVKTQLCAKAAQWGADQELEACCEWLRAKYWIESELTDDLRAARRPKPPSLKEQALKVLRNALRPGEMVVLDANEYALLCSALEALDD